MVPAETTKSPEPLAAFSKIPEEAASYESVCWQPCSLRTRLGTEAFREYELGWKQETLAALGSTWGALDPSSWGSRGAMPWSALWGQWFPAMCYSITSWDTLQTMYLSSCSAPGMGLTS